MDGLVVKIVFDKMFERHEIKCIVQKVANGGRWFKDPFSTRLGCLQRQIII